VSTVRGNQQSVMFKLFYAWFIAKYVFFYFLNYILRPLWVPSFRVLRILIVLPCLAYINVLTVPLSTYC